MPGRQRIYLAQLRKPAPPVANTPPPAPRPAEKSMAEKWAEYKRGEKKSNGELPSGT